MDSHILKKFIFLFILIFALPNSVLAAPYANSPIIQGITWDIASYQSAAGGSDLWTSTWKSDTSGDYIWTAWGDGGGFGGSDTNGRVATGVGRISGSGIGWTGTNVNGGVNSLYPASFPSNCVIPPGGDGCGKIFGMLAVNGKIYGWFNTQNRPFATNFSGGPDWKLVWSADGGQTWTKSGWIYPGTTGGLQPSDFLNMGVNYSGNDGYIYMTFSKWGDTHNGYLGRVSLGGLENNSNYQYYTGLSNGNPTWSSPGNSASAQPIFTDNAGTIQGQGGYLVYNPNLGRYLYSVSHGSAAQLGIFDGPNPWGPWTTVAYYENWAPSGTTLDGGEALAYSFNNKWTSKNSDGTINAWMLYGCYGCNSKYHDKLNISKAVFTLAGVAPAFTPAPTPTPTTPPSSTSAPTPTSPPISAKISQLIVNDTANAVDWSTRVNLQVGNQEYGDRVYKFLSIDSFFLGSDWIRPANDSKTSTGNPLATFKVNQDSFVYINYNDTITSKPSWMSGYTDTGYNLSDDNGSKFSSFSKWFSSGTTVSVGPNNGGTNSTYTILVKGAKAGDANGDGKIDNFDYNIWYSHYLQTTANGNSDADFNNDKIVDGIDYSIWINNYGN